MAFGDTIAVEYAGSQVGGFTIAAPSGWRYRFNPPYRRTANVRREDVAFFLEKGGYRILAQPTTPGRVAPASEAIPVAEIQARAAVAAATRASRASTPRPTPPQVVEQVMARAAETVGRVAPTTAPMTVAAEAPARRRRAPRVVDEKRTPQWKPPGF